MTSRRGIIDDFMTYINKEENVTAKKRKFACLPEDTNVPEESFKELCQKLLKTDQGLTNYHNMLLYLTGLLAEQCPNKLEEYSAELVTKMEEAGFEDTQWLDVLVEAKCNDKLATLIAPYYSDWLIVHDGHMKAALVLLKHLNTDTTVYITLENEVSSIPYLDHMLVELSKRECLVGLSLLNQWKNPEYGDSDECLQLLSKHGKCTLWQFTGNLTSLSHLPTSVNELYIKFTNAPHANQLLEQLSQKEYRFKWFDVRVMPNVQPGGLRSLSFLNTKVIRLCFPNVTGSNWKVTCEVIGKLFLNCDGIPKEISFRQCSISATQFVKMIIKLVSLNLKMDEKYGGFGGEIYIPPRMFDKEEFNKLRRLTRRTLGCRLLITDYDWL